MSTAMAPAPTEAGPGTVVPVPRTVLAGLLATAEHIQIRIDPIDLIRAGSTCSDRTVQWICKPDCPVCATQALLEDTPQ